MPTSTSPNVEAMERIDAESTVVTALRDVLKLVDRSKSVTRRQWRKELSYFLTFCLPRRVFSIELLKSPQ
jgi:hypothetical protein